jgi:hypothetical protein
MQQIVSQKMFGAAEVHLLQYGKVIAGLIRCLFVSWTSISSLVRKIIVNSNLLCKEESSINITSLGYRIYITLCAGPLLLLLITCH